MKLSMMPLPAFACTNIWRSGKVTKNRPRPNELQALHASCSQLRLCENPLNDGGDVVSNLFACQEQS